MKQDTANNELCVVIITFMVENESNINFYNSNNKSYNEDQII